MTTSRTKYSNGSSPRRDFLSLFRSVLLPFRCFGAGRLAFQTFGLPFLWSSEWDPVTKQFGALVPIYGTIVSSLIAMLLAVPVSFGIAVFLTQIAPGWLRAPVAAAVELLAGIPSIIYGMWGLFVFVPVMSDYVEPALNDYLGPLPIIGALFSGPPLGIGMLTAGIILGTTIVPFISSVMRDVFLAVPAPLKELAFAVGCTTWEVVSPRGVALYAQRRRRRDHARAWSRPGRDHGRNIRPRQCAQSKHFTA